MLAGTSSDSDSGCLGLAYQDSPSTSAQNVRVGCTVLKICNLVADVGRFRLRGRPPNHVANLWTTSHPNLSSMFQMYHPGWPAPACLFIVPFAHPVPILVALKTCSAIIAPCMSLACVAAGSHQACTMVTMVIEHDTIRCMAFHNRH
jgi:hypothetical protein